MPADPLQNNQQVRIGPYKARIGERFHTPSMEQELVSISTWTNTARFKGRLSAGTDPVSRMVLELPDGPLDLAVKCFARPGLLKQWWDRRRGSSARRSWNIATALRTLGIPSPAPVACLERNENGRLLESYFITVYAEGLTSFRNELVRLYRHDPDCGRLMALLQVVADALRKMHDAGVSHGDLGNQNILLRRAGDAVWTDITFIDLNRARVRGRSLSLQERARDLSRLHLPSDFLRIFFEMYFGGRPSPLFLAAQRRFRRRYQLRSRTRKLRHPIRSRAREKHADPSITYPPDRELWVWDDRSGQAISTLVRRDRKKLYPLRNHLDVARGALQLALPAWRHYRDLLRTAYGSPVDMTDRIGIAIEPRPATAGRELDLLRGLGKIPVLARFYHHERRADWDFTAGILRQLHQEGHAVSAALIQDRRAVRDPSAWSAFAQHVAGSLAGAADWLEIGHAFNRMKWGVWSFADYARIASVIPALRKQHPGLKLMGPAGIDFEYFALLGVLPRLDQDVRFDALSHLLYTDRRGAPENQQGSFATLEKLALARAIARAAAPRLEDRLIVSEVNWPLQGTGVFSPVCSPYLFPGQVVGAPNVSEDAYADYMIRYLLIALCSGLAERVYWWRLVARGFGLVDDTNPDAWRLRPAYHALQKFLHELGTSRFVRRESAPGGIVLHQFERMDATSLTLAYAHPGKATWTRPNGAGILLAGSPVYLS